MEVPRWPAGGTAVATAGAVAVAAVETRGGGTEGVAAVEARVAVAEGVDAEAVGFASLSFNPKMGLLLGGYWPPASASGQARVFCDLSPAAVHSWRNSGRNLLDCSIACSFQAR